MKPLLYLIALAATAHSTLLAGPAELRATLAPDTPWYDRHALDFETGWLGKVGGSTPLDYGSVPVMLSWRSPEALGLHFDSGSALVIRNRVTLLGQWFETGAENHYFGVMGAPSLEYWAPGGGWSLYFQIGGGVGWLDSQGVPGGQGQDFTLNWFAASGLSYSLNQSLQVRGGLMFQHLSNGGATDPNPGLDSLGVTLGLSWGF